MKSLGLIGYPLKHSVSPEIHKKLNKDFDYTLLEFAPNELNGKIGFLKSNFLGFNCTIPYKEKIIPFLDELDEKAKLYGAVNTVSLVNGMLIGYNTDAEGLKYALKKANISLHAQRVLILGAGGVARVLTYEAVFCNAEIFIYARTYEKAESLINDIKKNIKGVNISFVSEENLSEYDVILNGTPVGMWDKINELPVKKEVILKAKAVFDTIYNPINTNLVLFAKENGINSVGGLDMLIGQAIAAQKIWFDKIKDIDIYDEMKNIIINKFPFNIVLSGFMGSGKSYVGKRISKLLNREFIDLDECIENKASKKITTIFEELGEEAFRKMESKALEEAINNKGAVISLGGGTLTRQENIDEIKASQSFIAFLDVSKETILKRVGQGEDRPLLNGDLEVKVNKLYSERYDTYKETATIIVNGNNEVSEVANEIIKRFGLENMI
jgi:shikimate dehydrogenase